MNASPSTTRQVPRARPPIRMIVALGIAAVAAAGAFGLWYGFLRPAPAAVSIPAAAVVASAAPSGGAATPAVVSGASEVSGDWVVDPSVGSFSDYTGTFVGYRVQEELASIGAATAVGRTPDVTGSLTIDGTTLDAVEITVDLTTLESDNSMRDGQLQRQGLETGTYPTGTFVLTDPIELETIPTDGETISVVATGELTLHGTTQLVEIPLQAQVEGDTITVVGSLEIVFTDYGMTPPSSMLVLGIDDHEILELQLHFSRA